MPAPSGPSTVLKYDMRIHLLGLFRIDWSRSIRHSRCCIFIRLYQGPLWWDWVGTPRDFVTDEASPIRNDIHVRLKSEGGHLCPSQHARYHSTKCENGASKACYWHISDDNTRKNERKNMVNFVLCWLREPAAKAIILWMDTACLNCHHLLPRSLVASH